MDIYRNLDLDVIKKQVCEFSPVEEARLFIMDEQIDYNPLQIRKKILETAEALNLLKQDNNVSFDGIKSVETILNKADKGICLTGVELKDVLVFHHHCRRLKRQFSSFAADLSIRDYSDAISIDEKVFGEVEDCIDNSGEVKDDASPALKQIIFDLDRCEKDLYNKAHTFIDKHSASLQESATYLRDERITFLIKNADKNKFGGYVYGSSSSGLASYVEPASFIELNNRRIRLMEDREDEISRILMHLSYLVGAVSDDYRHDFESVLKLAVIFAKAAYGQRRGGILPEVGGSRYFEFKDLCHPLIDERKVVANTYRLYEPYQGIVISGSNTGGKTVSLKAIGSAIAMSYLGIPIIASEAVIPLYRNIYIDIDDNQSIADSLSTFSAHISNIDKILAEADERSLILIDELISGTDPKEAQAISLAILDKIKEICSVFIITTHFDDIKNYSYKDDKILLSAVGFNMDTLSPTYHYLEDSIGASNAIEIASRYFHDPALIERAREYMRLNKSAEDELLNQLAHAIEEAQVRSEKLDELIKENERQKKEYEDLVNKFESEKQKLKDEYVRKLNDMVEEATRKALEKLESIKEKDDRVIEEIRSLKKDELAAPPQEKREFKIGDNVRVGDNEQIGTITSLSGDQAIVAIRGLSIKTKTDRLKLMPKISKKQVKVKSASYKRMPAEINLVGSRVEDGLVMMEEFLDRANASHMSQVKVIHGIGTGTLRTALRQRLKKLSYVQDFHDGDYYDGGSAVTIVEFKK